MSIWKHVSLLWWKSNEFLIIKKLSGCIVVLFRSYFIPKICFEKYVPVFFCLVYICLVRWEAYTQKKIKTGYPRASHRDHAFLCTEPVLKVALQMGCLGFFSVYSPRSSVFKWRKKFTCLCISVQSNTWIFLQLLSKISF